MEAIHQNVALGRADDQLMLFADMDGSRSPLKNERRSDEHPFIKFVNSKNLPELLTAVDEIYDAQGRMDFIDDLTGLIRPESVGTDRAEEVAAMFEKNPTRTTIEKTREALGVWSFDNLRLSDAARINANLNDGKILYICTPLKDLIEAKEDLRRTSSLMAWLVGKCTFEMACDLTSDSKDDGFKTIDMKHDSHLAAYYKRLCNNPSNIFVALGLQSAVNPIHLHDESSIENTIRSYVRAAFSLLLSDEARKMSYNLIPYTSTSTILSEAWSFFATGLDKESGSGSITMCRHCGKFFQQQRSTKQFCSDSCRVMHLKKRPEQPEGKMRTTKTARRRKELKERKNGR